MVWVGNLCVGRLVTRASLCDANKDPVGLPEALFLPWMLRKMAGSGLAQEKAKTLKIKIRTPFIFVQNLFDQCKSLAEFKETNVV